MYAGIVGSLNTGDCTAWYWGNEAPSEPIAYCSNTLYVDDYVTEYHWGCDGDGSISLCEAVGSEGGCVSYEVSVTDVDCFGETETYDMAGYKFCCSSEDNCNHQNIDISNCQRSTAYEDLMYDLWECVYDYSDDVIRDFMCDIPLEADEEITCDGIRAIYSHDIGCYCPVYAFIHDRVGDVSKAKIQAVVDELVSDSAAYNGLLGCDIHLGCLLEGENAGQVYNRDGIARYDNFGVFIVSVAALILYYL